VAPLILPWNLYLNLTHRSFSTPYSLLGPIPSPFTTESHNQVSGFSKSRCHDPLVPDFLISAFPICSLCALAPPGYTPSHVTCLYMTAVIPFIGVQGFECRNALNLLSTESPISRFSIFRWMTFPFGKFPDNRDFCHTSSRMDGPRRFGVFSMEIPDASL
jgi:hypothetical protein